MASPMVTDHNLFLAAKMAFIGASYDGTAGVFAGLARAWLEAHGRTGGNMARTWRKQFVKMKGMAKEEMIMATIAEFRQAFGDIIDRNEDMFEVDYEDGVNRPKKVEVEIENGFSLSKWLGISKVACWWGVATLVVWTLSCGSFLIQGEHFRFASWCGWLVLAMTAATWSFDFLKEARPIGTWLILITVALALPTNKEWLGKFFEKVKIK